MGVQGNMAHLGKTLSEIPSVYHCRGALRHTECAQTLQKHTVAPLEDRPTAASLVFRTQRKTGGGIAILPHCESLQVTEFTAADKVIIGSVTAITIFIGAPRFQKEKKGAAKWDAYLVSTSGEIPSESCSGFVS